MIRFTRLIKSFVYASRGLAKVWREEQNFKIELLVGLLVIVVAVWLEVDYQDLVILLVLVGLVLIMETLNSVVEMISDVIKPKLDHYVKRIKDMIAAAVMLTAILAVIVGLLIFSHYF